jgi:TolB-like protein/tetratricopeptide (TPR) repeat protein
VDLSARSFEILALLLARPDEVIGKAELFEAVWPGLVVEENTLQVHISTLRKALDADMVMTVHGRGYKYAGPRPVAVPAGPAPGEPSGLTASKTPMPSKPSIAVLAFQNMSGDVEQEYFADGVADDIITALSRTSGLFVIARNSSFTYKGRAVDVKQVGRELGVRYVLEGSVRKSGSRVRITGQLIDTSTGAHLWADRFDGGLEDVFDLQDRVTSSVVGAIAPRVERAEIERAKRKPTESLDAYDHYLRGLAGAHHWSAESVNSALFHFRRAIELDPDFAAPYGLAARCYGQLKARGHLADGEQELAQAEWLAKRAAELGPSDAVALSTAGLTLAYVVGDLEAGVALTDRALALNPNLGSAWFHGGWVKLYAGEPQQAIERFANAMRLSPTDSELWPIQDAMCAASFVIGDFQEAIKWANSALSAKPDFALSRVTLAACNQLLGRPAEAQREVQKLLVIEPSLRVSGLRKIMTELRHPEQFSTFSDALREAGLPE